MTMGGGFRPRPSWRICWQAIEALGGRQRTKRGRACGGARPTSSSRGGITGRAANCGLARVPLNTSLALADNNIVLVRIGRSALRHPGACASDGTMHLTGRPWRCVRYGHWNGGVYNRAAAEYAETP
jgi:hypothetical protein